MEDGYYRIEIDGPALSGRGIVLLEGGVIHGIKEAGQIGFDGRYVRDAQKGIVRLVLNVRVPGGTYDVWRARLRPQPEVVAIGFDVLAAAPEQPARIDTASGPLTVRLHRVHAPPTEQKSLEHL
jgi:hypothetical protein